MAPRTTHHDTQVTQANVNDGNNNANTPHPADIERQAQENKKNAISLPYSRLLSILGAFLTLKALHAISALTNGKRPSKNTQLEVEARIIVHFLSIVPQSLYRPQSSTSIPCDGSGDSPPAAPAAPETGNTRGQVPVIDMANASTEEASSTYFNNPLMRTSSSLLPPMHMSQYVSQAGYSNGNGNGNGSGSGNGNPNHASNDSPALSFSAFALPSNTNRDDNSFIQPLAGCAPYRRAARESALSRDARRHEEINKLRKCYIERQEVSAESNISPEVPPVDERRADELHIANACPAQHHSGPEVDVFDQERTRSSFPEENLVSSGRGGERMAKPVTSVRPFTDLD